MRDLYNRAEKLAYWLKRIDTDLQSSDKEDVLSLVRFMQDHERSSLWIIRCITILIQVRKQLRKPFREASLDDIRCAQRYDRLQQWNQQHCIPPLPEKEFNYIWRWIVDRHRKQRDNLHQNLDDKRRKVDTVMDDPLTMAGCISYQINSIPDKYVLGTPDNKLVEVERKHSTDAKSNMVTSYLVTNKTFTACKPVRIVKHNIV